jgi:hypothetical protein
MLMWVPPGLSLGPRAKSGLIAEYNLVAGYVVADLINCLLSLLVTMKQLTVPAFAIIYI